MTIVFDAPFALPSSSLCGSTCSRRWPDG